MMEKTVLMVIQLVIPPILAVLIPNIISLKKKQLQFRYEICNTGDTCLCKLAIRNISTDYVFIDMIKLHKTYFCALDITSSFIDKSKLLEPGAIIEAELSETDIESLFVQLCKECNIKTDIRRLGCKLVIYSSSGQLTTKWFKMGFNKNGHWIIYKFIGYHNDYYNLRCRFISDLVTVRLIMMPALILYFLLFLLGEANPDYKLYCRFFGYLIVLLSAVMTSMDGIKRQWMIHLYSLISTVPAIIIFWDYFSEDYSVVIVLTLLVFGYTDYLLRCFSGWNL